ncbi:MAG: hypothetical protein A2V70_19150 [Planctomycetes bacterium RBG_13_63_9]|nr:MAG: hypothetical protein A2V70_19150 [Planctomycetes bacterium RBG_13_63_9]
MTGDLRKVRLADGVKFDPQTCYVETAVLDQMRESKYCRMTTLQDVTLMTTKAFLNRATRRRFVRDVLEWERIKRKSR